MRTTRWVLVIGLALGMAVPGSAPGQPGADRPRLPSGPPGPPGRPPDPALGAAGPLLAEIGLDAGQQRTLGEHVRAHLAGDLGSLARRFGQARNQLEQLLWNPEASDEAIIVASRAVAERALGLEQGRRRLILEVLAILTEEQREELRERLAAGPPRPPSHEH